MQIKKSLAFFLTLALSLTACGTPATPSGTPDPSRNPSSAVAAPTESVDLTVFAAASMTETLQKVAALYAKTAPNVKIAFNFDSSGTLKTQIQQGADCDLFLSAGQKQMNQLDLAAAPEANPEKLDFVLSSSRRDLLENRVALVVSEGKQAAITDFDTMAAALANHTILLAMGNSDVPVGQYTQKILAHYKLDEKALAAAGALSYGSNVKEVTTQVVEASVDCGIVYCTDAFSAKLKAVAFATPDMCGRVVYPAAVLKTAKQPAAAQAFLDYLSTPEAMAVFEGVGFTAA